MDVSQKDQALASSDTFQKLATEHSRYAQRLDALNEKRYLSEDEKIEEVRLKKLKLKLKDEMATLENQFHQRRHNVA
jgi:uncharacterized protein YdcH (DUF465 family)